MDDDLVCGIAIGFSVGLIAILVGVGYHNYYHVESCGSQWMSFKWRDLGDELDLKLFGQHIASYSVLKAVEGFMSNENPRKPLVLSLNGATGTGKNYIRADVIAQITLGFLKAGKKREEMKLTDVETSLSNSLFKDSKSGFFHSTLIDSNLVDYFVPFMPLEYRHVLQCVNAEMKVRGLLPNQEVADKLAKDLIYYPKDEKVFAAGGCKTIEKKLQFYL
ncbi:hypothetical protein INR49_022577 [Caranx melampygus]|nr:hypothetical protein INR49_022577 [Caranx melampygus]